MTWETNGRINASERILVRLIFGRRRGGGEVWVISGKGEEESHQVIECAVSEGANYETGGDREKRAVNGGAQARGTLSRRNKK